MFREIENERSNVDLSELGELELERGLTYDYTKKMLIDSTNFLH